MAETTESLPSLDTEDEDGGLVFELPADDGWRRRASKLVAYLLIGSCLGAIVTYIVAPSALVTHRETLRGHKSNEKLTHSEQVAKSSLQLSASNTSDIDPTADAEWNQLISLDDADVPIFDVNNVEPMGETASDNEKRQTTTTEEMTWTGPTKPWTWTSTSTTSTMTETPQWAPATASPNLYCWEYVFSQGEVDLAKAQLLYHASIFQCNKFDVFSLKKELLGGGPYGDVYTTVVPGPGAEVKWISQDGHPAARIIVNTPLFARIWDQVHKLKRYYEADWIVKVDADAVFLPERLRPHLAWKNINRDALVWFKNCQAPSWTTLQGPLEVFSHGAIDSFFANRWKCSTEESSNGAEDWFMAHCMEANGVHGTLDVELLNDNYCNHQVPVCDCSWGERSAYHPCKDVNSYFHCRNVAMGWT